MNIEELKAMSQEDLVRLVQELQEKLESENNSMLYWTGRAHKAEAKVKKLQQVANFMIDNL